MLCMAVVVGGGAGDVQRCPRWCLLFVTATIGAFPRVLIL